MTDPVVKSFKKLVRDINQRFDAIRQWTSLVGYALDDYDQRITALEAKVMELSSDD